jgi:formylglycine-generating enzyme required for sulfatase activity
LLRDVRRLLGAAADAGTEADVWRHRALVGRSRVAASFDAETANRLRDDLARDESPELRVKMVGTLQRWRGGLAKEVWFEELLNLDPKLQALLPEPVRTGDLAAACQFILDLAPGIENRPGALAWYRRLYDRATLAWHNQGDPAMRTARLRMFHEAFRHIADRPPPPPGYDPALIGGDPALERPVTVCQSGDALVVTEPGTVVRTGSLLATVRTANGAIAVAEGAGEGEDEADAVDREAFWKAGVSPAWADDWGGDDFGAWATFCVRGGRGEKVSQRLRWIRPGQFQMGSPENEPGRWGDEGPQHAVTISQGFWLFDTPCTQALWQAVMGGNPSRFKSSDRPVEQVSWNDIQDFLTRINRQLLGIDLDLPGEAQWEYACRAGTATALYTGGIEILGERNAPALDPIAWYGGNSGVDFDLKDGHDSKDWPGKQYPHKKAGTRSVGRKRPNPWGLHDMLGNVSEWCRDGLRTYGTGAEADPHGSLESGGFLVVRGGSWYGGARGARAAYRGQGHPDDRFDYLGFRCARVQASKTGGNGAEPAAPATGRQAERRTVQGATSAAGLRLDPGVDTDRCAVPRSTAFQLLTDRERLTFCQITRPEWAEAMGRDAFGLWAQFTIDGAAGTPPVTQRLRWIPPGRFLMGSPESEPERDSDEGPQHSVTISRGFWLFDTACPQALWQAVMGGNPSRFKSPDQPVENVSWDDAQRFVESINKQKPGLALRLPTEAQWEYACRAGTETPFSFGTDITPEQVNYDGNYPYASGVKGQYRQKTEPLASLPANAWGLFEMHGNVWEWCQDGKRTYTAAAETDPEGSSDPGGLRVVRGGSWLNLARGARAAYRDQARPDYRDGSLGFRCARVQA